MIHSRCHINICDDKILFILVVQCFLREVHLAEQTVFSIYFSLEEPFFNHHHFIIFICLTNDMTKADRSIGFDVMLANRADRFELYPGNKAVCMKSMKARKSNHQISFFFFVGANSTLVLLLVFCFFMAICHQAINLIFSEAFFLRCCFVRRDVLGIRLIIIGLILVGLIIVRIIKVLLIPVKCGVVFFLISWH